MKANIKISQFSRFLLRSEYPLQVKIWKWLKLLNSVPFIKKPLVNQVCIRIWSFWLTFTVLQWTRRAEECPKSRQINCADISMTECLHKFQNCKVYQATFLAIYIMIEYKYIDKEIFRLSHLMTSKGVTKFERKY